MITNQRGLQCPAGYARNGLRATGLLIQMLVESTALAIDTAPLEINTNSPQSVDADVVNYISREWKSVIVATIMRCDD